MSDFVKTKFAFGPGFLLLDLRKAKPPHQGSYFEEDLNYMSNFAVMLVDVAGDCDVCRKLRELLLRD